MGWAVGEEVILHEGQRRTVTTVTRVTPSGLCDVANSQDRFDTYGRMRGGSGWRSYLITRPRPGEVDEVRAECELRKARGDVRAAVDGEWNALTIDQCRAILAAMEVP